MELILVTRDLISSCAHAACSSDPTLCSRTTQQQLRRGSSSRNKSNVESSDLSVQVCMCGERGRWRALQLLGDEKSEQIIHRDKNEPLTFIN